MAHLRLVAGTARFGKKQRDRSAACFFCGATFTLQNGDQICCAEVQGVQLPPSVDRHVCPECAGAKAEVLQARLKERIGGLQGRAAKLRAEADALDALAETLNALDVKGAERVWHPSLFNR